MTNAKQHPIITTIHSQDEIPTFASEEEEHRFWQHHEIADELWDQMPTVPDEELPRPRTKPVPVRFDEDVLRRLKALAAKRHTGYQTLLKQFVVERLYEEEKREGLV
jgi:predicted DNA binding CopG/RHH family protein